MNLSRVFGCSFIYALCDPDTGECRYVGKADDPRRRYQCHIAKSKRTTSETYNTHSARWIRKLALNGKLPTLRIIEWVSKDSWQHRECYWIELFKDLGCNLTNLADGGRGGRGRGWKMSAEHKANLSAARKGRKFGPRGPFSEKAREAIRQGLLRAGVKPPPHAYVLALEVNKGRVAWNRGKKMSPETCAKLSAVKIGNTNTLGHKNSPEVRDRKRQAQLRRWESYRQVQESVDGL